MGLRQRLPVGGVPPSVIVAFAFSWSSASVYPLDSVLHLEDFRIALMLLLLGAFSVLAALHRVADRLLARPAAGWIVYATGLAAAGGGCLLGFVPVDFRMAAALACSGCLALLQAVSVVGCLRVFARASMVQALVSFTLWQLLAAFLKLLDMGVTLHGLQMASPVVIAALWLGMTRGRGGPIGWGDATVSLDAECDYRDGRARLPWRLIGLNTVLVFSIYLCHTMTSPLIMDLWFAGTLLSALVVALVLLTSGNVVRVRPLHRAALVLFALSLVALAGGTGEALVVSAVVGGAAYVTFSAFFLTVLCNIGRRFQVGLTVLFAVAYSAECAGGFLGALPSVVPLLVEAASPVLPVALAALVAIAFLFLSPDDYRASWGADGARKGLVDPGAYYYSLSEICSSITMQYALSRRESDVLLLLAQKKTATEIAEELYVSNSTVKTHIRNIYRKLGIHRKAELLEFIEGPLASPAGRAAK